MSVLLFGGLCVEGCSSLALRALVLSLQPQPWHPKPQLVTVTLHPAFCSHSSARQHISKP